MKGRAATNPHSVGGFAGFAVAMIQQAIIDRDVDWINGKDSGVTFEDCCDVLAVDRCYVRRMALKMMQKRGRAA